MKKSCITLRPDMEPKLIARPDLDFKHFNTLLVILQVVFEK